MNSIQKLADIEMEGTSQPILSFPWEEKRAYALWCASTYQFVRHSTRLVALAAACMEDQPALHSRFLDHAREEKGHDRIAIHDLESLGIHLEDLPVVPEAVALAQMQYYWIQFRSPCSLLGYILFLETLAVKYGPELYRRVVQAHGKESAHFLRVHTADDIEHVQKAIAQIETLKQKDRDLVIENFGLSAGLYRSMLREICRVKEPGAQPLAA